MIICRLMHALKLQNFLLFLTIAALLVPLLRSWRVHSVLAFLLAGVLFGPHGLGALTEQYHWLRPLAIHNTEGAAALAEIGIVLLLFLIGLEISWERLWNMRHWIFGIGSAQLLICGAIIAGVAIAFGNTTSAALVLGGCLALSSTAIVMQLINEQRALGSPLGQVSFAILLLQDLAVVPLLLVIGLLGAQTQGSLWLPMLIAFAKAFTAIFLIVVLGRLLLRPVFKWVVTAGRSEAFMALVLLVALGTGVLTAWFGLSMALGAFLAGLLLAETQYRHEIELKLEAFDGLLMGVFFLSVGMNINITYIMQEPLRLLLSVIGLMLMKTIVVAVLLRLNHFRWGEAWRGGLLLSQAGEFGFIVVSMATTFHLLGSDTGQFLLLMVSCSMFVTPMAAELGIVVEKWLMRRHQNAPVNDHIALPAARHVLIAGCGRVGTLVAKVLDAEKQPWIAIEKSAVRVEALREQGFPIIYGDVTNSKLMHKLHADNASAVVITVDDTKSGERAVAAVRAQFPDTPIYARACDSDHAKRLLACGATAVIPDAVEAGLQLSALTLKGIGVPETACQDIVSAHRDRELVIGKLITERE